MGKTALELPMPHHPTIRWKGTQPRHRPGPLTNASVAGHHRELLRGKYPEAAAFTSGATGFTPTPSASRTASRRTPRSSGGCQAICTWSARQNISAWPISAAAPFPATGGADRTRSSTAAIRSSTCAPTAQSQARSACS